LREHVEQFAKTNLKPIDKEGKTFKAYNELDSFNIILVYHTLFFT